MYHSVGGMAYGDDRRIFTISAERLEEHARYLAGKRIFSPVALYEGARLRPSSSVSVTFDDGYRDNLTAAAPILLKYGIPFAVFVTTDWVRRGMNGILSRSELRELAGLSNVTIGSHGKSHIPLAMQATDVIRNELVDSKKFLEDLLGTPVRSVAYPYGSADLRVREEARRAGYELGLCTRFEANNGTRDPLMLTRCSIEHDDNCRAFSQKLFGDWDWYRFRTVDPLRLADGRFKHRG